MSMWCACLKAVTYDTQVKAFEKHMTQFNTKYGRVWSGPCYNISVGMIRSEGCNLSLGDSVIKDDCSYLMFGLL